MSMIYAMIKNDDLISTFSNVEMCIENVSTNAIDKLYRWTFFWKLRLGLIKNELCSRMLQEWLSWT